MFTKLANFTFGKDFTNILFSPGKVLRSYIGCSRRVDNAHLHYKFDHDRKAFDFNSNRQFHNQPTIDNVVIANERNEDFHKGWSIPSWTLVIGGIIAYLWMNGKASAEDVEVPNELTNLKSGQTKVVTKDNFRAINIQLKQDNPAITALEMHCMLSEVELRALYDAIQDNTELGYVLWHKDQIRYEILEGIEKRLILSNKNYRYHPSDYVHALLSKHVYRDSKQGDIVVLDTNVDEHLKNWRVEKVYDDTPQSGYYGVIYKNDKTHQVVLAVRGTEDGIKGIIKDLPKHNSDWKTNLEEILGGQIIVGQQARNYEATEKAVKIAEEAGYRLSVTGHSLGAWLAELSAFYSHVYFGYRNIKAVTFDSPGTEPMMKKLQSNIKAKGTRAKLEDIEIVTYLASPNPVNCCNAHVGTVYRIEPELKWTKWVESKIDNISVPNMFKAPIDDKIKSIKGGLSIEGHGISGILETFDPETGKPRECKKMLDWPKMEYNGDERTFSNQGKTVLKEGISNSDISSTAKTGVNFALNYVVGDRTLMAIIGFLKNVIQDEIDQKQYWAYFSYIDSEQEGEENSELRKKLRFDDRFALIAQAKYREGKDQHIMELTTGSVDKYLYKLYEFKDKLNEKENLPPVLRTQLNELLSSFSIEPNGQQNLLIPHEGHTVESIRQRTQRLLQVVPKDVRKVWESTPINNEIIVSVADGSVTITDKRITQLPDHLSWQTAHYTVIHDKEKELKDKLSKDQIVVISGAGGMGKSTLATSYGKELKRVGWQVRWLKGMQIDEEFFQLAKDLNIKTTNLRPEEIRDLVYRELEKLPKGQQLLLIFDNVEASEKERIHQYLINLPNRAKVIVTSKTGNILEGIKPIAVKGFNKKEAITYLRDALGASESDAEKLVAAVGESPFRLSKAVAYIRRNSLMSVADYIVEYESIKRGDGQNEEIYPEVKMLFGNLKNESPESWQLLKYLAYLDAEGISVKLLANVMEKTERQLQPFVNILEGLSLLSVSEEGNQKVIKVSHRIVQSETKTALAEEDKAQVKKILEELIGELNQELPNVDDNLQISKAVSELISHAKLLIEESKSVNSSIVGMENLLAILGLYYYRVVLNSSEAIQYWEQALDCQRLVHKGNHPNTARLLSILGLAFAELGGDKNIRIGIKHHEDALMMRKVLFQGSHPLLARSYSNLAMDYKKLGDKESMRKALILERTALEMYQVLYLGGHLDKAKSLHSVGAICVSLESKENA